MYTITPDAKVTFDFEHEGTQYSVPLVKHLPLNKMRDHDKALRKLKPEQKGDFEAEFMASLFDEYAPGVTEQLTGAQFRGLIDAYLAECNGATPGE